MLVQVRKLCKIWTVGGENSLHNSHQKALLVKHLRDKKPKLHLWKRLTFGARLYRLACRCGYREADEKLFAADGGEWCWSIHQQYLAVAQGILGRAAGERAGHWYHASEHVWDTARVLHPDDDEARRQWADQALTHLHDGGGCALLEWLTTERSHWRCRKRKAVTQLMAYVQPRLDRTDDPTSLAHGWQIGSGMIESTAKQLVGLRLKGPGMHWSEPGALTVTA